MDVKIIRGALNAARRQGLIPTNPAEAVELPEAESMERGTFTPAEVKMLVDTAEGEWKALIHARLLHRRRGFPIAAGCNGTAWTWPEKP